MRGAWVAALLVSLALAGCSGGKDGGDGQDDQDADGQGTGAAGNATSSLRAVITVSVNGTQVLPANGTFALDLGVEATFDATNSTGAVLTYAWDFGDNATSSNRSQAHTYAAPGNYTVRLTVANGNLTSNATVDVQVTGTAAGALLGTTSTPFEGELPGFNVNSCMVQGFDCQDHAITVAADFGGAAAMAVAARINLTASGGNVQMNLYWRSPDGTVLAQSNGSPIVFEEPMPAGDYVVRVRVFVGASTSYEGTVDIDYATA